MKFIYLLYRAAGLWVERGTNYYAAAFSYYAPLALIPLLFFSVAIASFFYGQSFATTVYADWGSVLGEDLLAIIKAAIENLNTETASAKVPLIAGLFFLGFYVIALNVISDGFEKLWGRETKGIRSFIRKSLRAIGFLVVLQVYLIFVIGVDYFIIPTLFGVSPALSFLFLFVSTAIFFTFLYKWLVPQSPRWRGCIAGAVVSATLFVTLKTMVDVYIATTPVLSLYGAGGLILVLFVWVYILASLIYYGAAVAGLYVKIDKQY
jgi:membrane protein